MNDETFHHSPYRHPHHSASAVSIIGVES
ncbi:hypothetical protein EQV77_09145 [Halobacillus fulvus]|nr:hypothetical protein EQV77_09145 [Halobacillus fulvus]